jgi:deoxyribose-phosphate aldolase
MPSIASERVAAHPNVPAGPLPRNPGMPLDLDWVAAARVDRSASERRTSTLTTRRSVKADAQAAWLLKAITLIDLTTLAGDDTPGRVRRLCAKARSPLRPDLVAALGMEGVPLTTGAVCVYHAMVPAAASALEGSGVPVAAVATGFPTGLTPLATRLAEIRASVAAGAEEIDVVIARHQALAGDWAALYEEVQAFREACGPAHLKVILGTGDLGPLRTVARASLVAMMAGADFVKTSTGKEAVNATLPVSLTMARTVRDYAERTGFAVGFKPAGGIRTAKDALAWMVLMREELGRRWCESDLLRFGASGLLGDIERQLEHHVTGRYAALHKQPLA